MVKTYLIFPAYNESKRIRETLDAYCKHFYDSPNEIVFVIAINNTTDDTEDIVKEYEDEYFYLNHLTLPGKGKGYAIIEGWKNVLINAKEDDYIGFVDADNATPPEAFEVLINKLNDNKDIDGVIGSRYIKGAVVKKQTLRRIFVSRVFNLLVKSVLLLPYSDTQAGCKLFRTNAIYYVIHSIGNAEYAFDVDLLYNLKKKGFKIKEVPITWNDKKYSKINLMEAGPRMAWAVLKLRFGR
jgi:glycosyltransferase involved in cell wall biosynthesis